MARGSQRPNHQIPVCSHHLQPLFNATQAEAQSMLNRGQATARRNRHRHIIGLIQVAPPAAASNSKENAASLTQNDMDSNAGLVGTPGWIHYMSTKKVPLFDPALSEVRTQALKYASAAELAQLEQTQLPRLKRALQRAI